MFLRSSPQAGPQVPLFLALPYNLTISQGRGGRNVEKARQLSRKKAMLLFTSFRSLLFSLLEPGPRKVAVGGGGGGGEVLIENFL